MKTKLIIFTVLILCFYTFCHNDTTSPNQTPTVSKSSAHVSSSVTVSSKGNTSSISYSKPLTKEQADKLRGTSYGNTRPHSFAENIELAAAQVKCKNCGRHSDNGNNSSCDYCRNAARIRGYTIF